MSAEALREEIRKSSQDRAREVLTEAKKKADGIVNEAESEANNVLEKRLREAKAQLEQTEKFERAKVKIECTKNLLRLQSSYFEQAFHEAELSANKLSIEDPDLYEKVLSNFIVEAVERIGDTDLEVVARDSDKLIVQRILDDLRSKSKNSVKCSISQSESLQSSGGVIVHSPNMRTYYINTFESRFAKVREDFRADVVEVLEKKE